MTSEQFEFEFPILTEAGLKKFVEVAWGVDIPNVRVCPNHCTPWEAFRDAYFAKSPVSVWMGSRGFGGKTFTLGTLALTEAIGLGAEVKILGGSADQSKRVLETQTKLWRHPDAPMALLASDPSASKVRLRNGATIQALTASQKSARGAHPQRLRMDEIDEMDIKILDAALGQQMEDARKPWLRAHCVMSSTRQYMDKTMAAILERANEVVCNVCYRTGGEVNSPCPYKTEGEKCPGWMNRRWPVYEWCYKETLHDPKTNPKGWLTKQTLEDKRNTVTSSMWEIEYELQEPNPEGRAFDLNAIKRMFRKNVCEIETQSGVKYLTGGEFSGALGKLIEADGLKGQFFAHGSDWADLKDWTIMVTLQLDGGKPYRLVSFEREGRAGYPIAAAKFSARIERMFGTAYHDGTGVGHAVHQMLTAPAIEFKLNGEARARLFSDYIFAVEKGEIVCPYIEHMYKEHSQCSRDDLFKPGNHPPDSVVAMALAYRAAKSMVGFDGAGPTSIGTQTSHWRTSRE